VVVVGVKGTEECVLWAKKRRAAHAGKGDQTEDGGDRDGNEVGGRGRITRARLSAPKGGGNVHEDSRRKE